MITAQYVSYSGPLLHTGLGGMNLLYTAALTEYNVNIKQKKLIKGKMYLIKWSPLPFSWLWQYKVQ